MLSLKYNNESAASPVTRFHDQCGARPWQGSGCPGSERLQPRRGDHHGDGDHTLLQAPGGGGLGPHSAASAPDLPELQQTLNGGQVQSYESLLHG